MKKSIKVLLAVTAACLCVMLGIFIGRNMLPNYYMKTYSSGQANAYQEADGDAQGRININTASAADLTQLPGIGKTTAERIVAYRNLNGSFTSVDDLLNVEGIGYGTLYNIHDFITTGG